MIPSPGRTRSKSFRGGSRQSQMCTLGATRGGHRPGVLQHVRRVPRGGRRRTAAGRSGSSISSISSTRLRDRRHGSTSLRRPRDAAARSRARSRARPRRRAARRSPWTIVCRSSARLLAGLAGVAGQAEDDLRLERREHLDRRAELVDPFRGSSGPGNGTGNTESVPGCTWSPAGRCLRSFAADSASFDRSSAELELPDADPFGAGLPVVREVLVEGRVEGRHLRDGEAAARSSAHRLDHRLHDLVLALEHALDRGADPVQRRRVRDDRAGVDLRGVEQSDRRRPLRG